MKKLLIIFGVFILIIVGAVICFSGGELSPEEKEREYNEGHFIEGIYLNGEDIGGLTLSEVNEIAKDIESELAEDTVLALKIMDEEYILKSDIFNISFNTQEVLKEAILAGKGGNMLQRREFRLNGDKRFYIEKRVTGIDDALAIERVIAKMNRKAQDASMEFTPGYWEPFKYSKEAVGIEVDEKALKENIIKAVNNEETAIDVPYTEVLPKTTIEDIKNAVVRRSYFETSYADAPYNDKDRAYNIEKCVSIINDKKIVMAPGESLSLNKILGDRTQAGGWRLAPGYVLGRSEDQAGGGVCQISSTLYCAALKADLTVVKRQNHSIPVGYVNQGLDATISTGGPDLVLRNDTKENIYICCGLSGKKSVYFQIYGTPFNGFTKILINSQKVRDISPDWDVVYTYTDELNSGEEEVYVKRRDGSEYEAYKSYYNGDELIKKVKISSSIYPSYSGEVRVGK